MPLLSALSRRALVVAALPASAPIANAKQRKRHHHQPEPPAPPPPLAFVTATVTGVRNGLIASEPRFMIDYQSAWQHPADGRKGSIDGVLSVPVASTETETRAAVMAGIRNVTADGLAYAGLDVPADRIAVVVV
jgi:hypothetical protein